MKKLASLSALVVAALVLASCGSADDSSDKVPSNETQAADVVPAPSVTDPSDSRASQTLHWPYEEGDLLSGTANPNFPEGEPGEVSVIMVGPRAGSKLLFVYRNNTEDYIAKMDWTATVRSGGQLVATGGSQGDLPAQVAPGGIGFSYIYIPSSVDVPADADYSFDVEYDQAGTESFHNAPLVITELNNMGEAIVGEATNRSGVPIKGSYNVSVFCFDGDDLLFATGMGAANDQELADGDSVPFLAELYGRECPTYLAAVSGYFQ